MVFITRKETFNAAHRLFRPEWSDEKNFEIFGKCSNPNWHGHNYTLFVTVKGTANPDTGMVINLKELSSIIRNEIIEKIDHKNMNLEVDFMKGLLASTENIAIAIFNLLKPLVEIRGAILHKVKLEETENNFVEYYGKPA